MTIARCVVHMALASSLLFADVEMLNMQRLTMKRQRSPITWYGLA